MIVYQGNLRQFSNDVLMGMIAERIEKCFKENGINHNNPAEYRAFNNSLMVMNNVLCNNSGINQDVNVAMNIKFHLLLKE